jgi:Ca-activated chloride channel homolog
MKSSCLPRLGLCLASRLNTGLATPKASHVSRAQVSWPQVSWPQVSWPQVSWPQVSWPQVSWPQVSWPQVFGPQVSRALAPRTLVSGDLLSRSVALAACIGLCWTNSALAAGLIMIDPGFAPIRPMHVVRPGTAHMGPGIINVTNIGIGRPPGVLQPPNSTAPVLHGGVTFGLRLESQDIKVEINDQVARTNIEQTFANDGDQNLAGTYLFPLPEDTTFSSFSLHIDGKPVEGKILEAQAARAQYEEIVRRMVDPGLLEYADYKTVRARIFPIPAHGTKKVELEYTQILKAENGLVKYRFPLKGDSQAQGDVDETKVSVKLSGKQALRTIWSPSHTVDVKREENNRAKVAFIGHGGAGTDKDFNLYYSVSDKEMQANLLTNKVEGEDGYFLLTLAPPLKNAVVQPKDIVLVADTSGSMQGEKIDQTKKALKYVVNALGPADRFGLVQFNTDADGFKSTLVAASAENKKAADAYIDDLEPRGGTNISGALNLGVSLLNNADTRPAYLILMTDGEPTVGETSLPGLLKSVQSKRDLRLFDFGVGYDVNTRLLSRLAEDHHGTSQFLEPGENLESALAAFYNKIKSPVLADCQLTYNGINVKDVYPRAVKDIFAGTQVLLLGRYKGDGKASVTVAGKVNGQPRSYVFPVEFAKSEASNGYLPRLWAMRRIGHLTDAAQENGDNREVVDEIVALSQKYGIISAYTSFLVTDPNESNQRLGHMGRGRGNVVPMPAPMPTQLNQPWSPTAMGGPASRNSRAMSQAFPRSGGAGGGVGGSAGLGTSASMAVPMASPIVHDMRTIRAAGRLVASADSSAGPDLMMDWHALQAASKTQDREGGNRWTYRPNVSGSKSMTVSGASGHNGLQQTGWYKSNMAAEIAVDSSVVGKRAVEKAKKIAMLKDSDESTITTAVDNLDQKQGMKQAEGKTFYLDADGQTWVDSQYRGEKVEEIAFASARYFELAKGSPKLASYLAVGQQVIFVYQGHAYKVTVK